MSYLFLDLFSYESKQNHPNDGSGSTSYEDCIMLRDFGDLKKGDKIKWLSMNINLLGDKNNISAINIDTTSIYMEQ